MKRTRKDGVELIEDAVVFAGFNRMRRLTLRFRRHDGAWSNPIEREVFDRFDAIVVLPYDPHRDRLLLVEQFRAGAFGGGRECWDLEPIGGLLEKDKDVERTVRREALEEAGCQVGAIEEMGKLIVSPACTTQLVHVFCAEVDLDGAGGIHGLSEEEEDIRTHLLDFADAHARLQAGQFPYLITNYCLFWLAANRERLRRLWAR